MSQPSLSSLLVLWGEAQEQGRDLPAEALCPDDPTLAAELARCIAFARRMRSLADLTGATHDQGATSVTDPPPTLPTGSAVGEVSTCVHGYEVLEELGRGGMGVVYKARQVRLNRIVALKMVLAGGHAGPEERLRFLAEAEAIAALRHPNIVSLLELGVHQGLPFFTLEFVPGGSLAARLGGSPLPPLSAARLVEQLARAAHFAHEHGIVHRDLKPANVLLAEDGTPKITDFGLARRVEAGTGLTGSDAVMGTPSYMAPEQASGATKSAGPAADIYSLGAILYECLTGRPPFKAATIAETLLQVLRQEAVSVRQVQPQTPSDLATICHKCLQKEPHKRYASALALAEDCAAFLDGRPIRARPVGQAERAWRWCRRHPAIACLLALVTVTLLAGTVVSLAFAFRAEHQRQAASDARYEAEKARKETQRQLIDLASSSGLAAARQSNHAEALLWFAHAVRLARDDPERQELNRIRVRNWERHVLQPVGQLVCPGFRANQDRFRVFAFHPSSRYLLALTSAERCSLWDVQTGQEVALPGAPRALSAAAWGRDGKWLALGTPNGKVEVRAFPSLKLLRSLQTSGKVQALAFGPGDRYLAMGTSKGARVWDRTTQAFVTPLLPHPRPVLVLTFNARGDHLATTAEDALARVFAVPSDRAELIFPPVPHSLASFGVSHGGPDATPPLFVEQDKILVTIGDRNSLVWRDADTGKQTQLSAAPAGQDYLTSWALSPDGQRLGVLWAGTGRLYSLSPDLPTLTGPRGLSWGEDLTFSPDGALLASCGHDNTVRFCSVKDAPDWILAGRLYPLHHPGMVVRVRFSPDGSHLAAALWDGAVCLWRFPVEVVNAYRFPAQWATRVVLSPDGRLAMASGSNFRSTTLLGTQVIDATTGKAVGAALHPGGILLDALFSPDGRRVATASSAAATPAERQKTLFAPDGRAGNVQVWDWRSGKRLLGPIGMPTEPRGLAYRPDGKRLAVTCADGWVVVLDEEGKVRHRLDSKTRSRPLNANLWWSNGLARFSPDGRWLVTWEMAPIVHVWDAEKGKHLFALRHEERIEAVDFGPKPNLLLTCGRDSQVRIWDLEVGRLAVRPLRHPRYVPAARFSPDGKQVISGCDDGHLRIWDWRTGRLLAGHSLHRNLLLDFAFTPDRRWLLTTGIDETRLSDARTGHPMAPRLPGSRGTINLRVVVPRDGSRAIVSGFSGALLGHDLRDVLTPSDASIEEITLRAELASGQRIQETGSPIQLTAEEWAERWRRLSK